MAQPHERRILGWLLPSPSAPLAALACLALLGAGQLHAALILPITTAAGNGADAYINSGTSANANFGTNPALILKTDGATSNTARLAYTRFDLGSLLGMRIQSATLQLQTSTNNSGGTNPNPSAFTVEVWGLSNQSLDLWGESTITWNNSPAHTSTSNTFQGANATLLGTFAVPANPAGDILTFSNAALTSFLNADTNGVATLMLRRTSGSSPNLAFASRENLSALPPTLFLAVPEPGRALLLALALGALVSRRRRP